METSNLRSEIHIAQQSRRERLRIQQQLNHQDRNVDVYTNNSLEHDASQFHRLRCGDLAYNPIIFPSEMANFSVDSQPMLAHNKDVQMVQQQESSTSQSDKLVDNNMRRDPQNFRTWKSIGPNNTRDWCSRRMEMNKNTSFIIGGLSDPLKANNPSPSAYDYQYVTSSLAGPSSEVSTRIGQKRYGDVEFTCPSAYQNVTCAPDMSPFAQQHTREPCHATWASNSNAFDMIPSFEEVDASENPNTQGLVLSLSSVPLTKQNQCQAHERSVPMELNSGDNCFGSVDPQAKVLMSEYTNLCPKLFNTGNSTSSQRSIVGPLGPFTGYATILKTSKFLRPAQQLLHEFCTCGGLENTEVSMRDSHGTKSFGEDMDCLGGSSSSPLRRLNEDVQEAAGSSSPHDSCRPEFLQKKAKLLYMQDEVFRRYKHYHQQMQMVVSSFETVAGLSAATPYISVALKTVSRLFRNVRNAISDHLKNVRKALGEDSSSLTAIASSSKNDTSSSRHKSIDPLECPKQKASVRNLGLFEHQQNVWRPQRGLPERAVAILRAWLFDHFLHPYPTDSDKHMLASQTGLTRNQVSNWFINARVRIWKPMVEEIHSLETKETAEPCTIVAKNDGKAATDDGSSTNAGRPFNTIPATGMSGKQVEFPGIGASDFTGNQMSAQTWNQNTTCMDFVPYHHGGIDLGGLGAVSLTLGLRQNVGGGPPPRRRLPEQPGNQIRTHFGDHIVYDFVG